MELEELVTAFAAFERLDIELDQRRTHGRHDVEGFDRTEGANGWPDAPVFDLASHGFPEEIT
jgi:hypothetical protein